MDRFKKRIWQRQSDKLRHDLRESSKHQNHHRNASSSELGYSSVSCRSKPADQMPHSGSLTDRKRSSAIVTLKFYESIEDHLLTNPGLQQ